MLPELPVMIISDIELFSTTGWFNCSQHPALLEQRTGGDNTYPGRRGELLKWAGGARLRRTGAGRLLISPAPVTGSGNLPPIFNNRSG